MFCANMIRMVLVLMKQILIPVRPLQKTFLIAKFGKSGIKKMKRGLRNGQSVVPELVLDIILEIREMEIMEEAKSVVNPTLMIMIISVVFTQGMSVERTRQIILKLEYLSQSKIMTPQILFIWNLV